MDRTDFEILGHLQNNARLSNKELSHLVGLAASSCLERVRRLVATGVLQGFHARVRPEALGVGLEALIAVRLRQHSREMVQDFWAHALRQPEVVACFHVAGAHDFLVHVAVRDAHHLRDFAMDAFTTRAEVAHLETSLIFECAHKSALPVYAAPQAPAPAPATRPPGAARRRRP